MVDLVTQGALNNVLQSEAVLTALGSTGTFDERFWSNDHTFDVPYANGASLGTAEATVDHYRAIEQLLKRRPPGAATFVMDSFATLDLEPQGFQVRIADEWFVSTGSADSVPAASAGHVIERIETADGLAEFEAAGAIAFDGVAPDQPGHTYLPALLADGRFTFFALRVDGRLAAGVFLFRDPACTGVFTFFTLPDYRGQGLGSAILQTALATAPAKPLVTNPSDMSRGIFARLGFQPAGERRIWERPASISD